MHICYFKELDHCECISTRSYNNEKQKKNQITYIPLALLKLKKQKETTYALKMMLLLGNI